MITSVLIALSYRSEFFTRDRFRYNRHISPFTMDRCWRSPLFVMAVMVVLFFFGQPVAKVAIVGGAFSAAHAARKT